MFLLPNRAIAAMLACSLVALGAAMTRADDLPLKDDALDRLLEKIADPSAKPGADTPKDNNRDTPTKPGTAPVGEKPKPPGDLSPKDQALDNLLEKLGETRDRPMTEDEKRAGRPMPGEEGKDKDKGKDDQPQPKPGELTGKEKELDEHLEELTGRKRKKKQGDDDEGSGPLGQVIKEMREVEQRLGKPDTGEETRKKQTQIVKNLDQLIEQMKSSSEQAKAQKKSRMVMQAGQQNGPQPGQTPGGKPGEAPNSKPAKPESKHAFARGKDEWGHLPPEFRQEMDNVAKEVMLPSKEELIRLYYLSVSKKSQAREE